MSLNYFSYFTEIEDAFVRRRQKHLYLSPLDWALMETWKEREIPLHVVLRSIERWFNIYETRRRRRSVNTLLYCQEEVEAQYGEWLESRTGSNDNAAGRSQESEEGQTFSRAAILEHLRHAQQAVLATLEQRKSKGEDDLTEALARAANQLCELVEDFAASVSPDVRGLEDSLTVLERMLNDVIRVVVPADDYDATRKTVVQQLRPYRSQMDKEIYNQTLNNLLLKRLREQLGVPRLSLFYL